jgi:hypothetical protein
MAWYDKWAIMLIAAAVGLAGYEGIPWRSMDITIWAYWIGAIGTVGTLMGTIWLATSESRRRETENRTRAQMHAVSIKLRLTHIRSVIGYVCRGLDAAAKIDHDPAIILRLIEEVRPLKIITIDELIPLSPLPDGIAGKLAQAADEIRTTVLIFDRAKRTARLSTPEKRAEFCTGMHLLLSDTARLLDAGVIACDAAKKSLLAN